MPYFLVSYRYTGDVDARMRVRPAHREFLAQQQNLLASGPTDDGGAVLVLEAACSEEVETLLDDDPIARHGFVGTRSVVAWDVVLGRWAR
ncbi:MAG: YciI family protein [Actinomycetes bacterium]